MGDKRNREKRTKKKIKRKRAIVEQEESKKNAIKNAAIVQSLLTGMLRNILRIEILLGQWVKIFPVQSQKIQRVSTSSMAGHVDSIGETIYQFLSRLMNSPACLRIENQCLVFLECSEFRIFYKDLTKHENALLLYIVHNWADFFGKMIQMMHTSMCPTYVDFLYNNIVESCFPRTQLACRYIAQLLRINGRGDSPGELGAHYQWIWLYVYKAVMSLYTRGNVPDIKSIRPMLDILMKPATVVCYDWDPEKSVHP